MKKTIQSGRIWENIVGYSRIKIINNIFVVAGTTASDKDGHIYGNTAASQTEYICTFVKNILESNSISFEDITRTRIYLKNINDWQEVGIIHKKFFQNILPVTTILEVSALTVDEMLVEIEFEGVISNKR